MRTIYNKYDKNKINTLPQELFSGKIVVIQSESEAEKAVDYLLKSDIMGVDTETRPTFKKGQMHKVAFAASLYQGHLFPVQTELHRHARVCYKVAVQHDSTYDWSFVA